MDLDAPPSVPDSPAGVLRAATEVVRRRRLVEVEDLEVLAAWAALHSAEPTSGRRGDVLVLLGGEGTPEVQDFCLGEIALARGTGVTATTNALADVLDLRHRLPRVWARCRAGEAEVFVARRVAKLSRHLPLAAVARVDAAVAQVLATESGGRTLAVAEGAIVAADPALHDERVDEQRKRRYVGLGRVDEFGLRTIIARTEAADAVWLDDLLDRVAQVIAPQHPDATPQEIRAVALGLVARPAEVLALLGESTPGETERARQAPRVVLHVHLHEAALAAGATTPGSVARVEGLGPRRSPGCASSSSAPASRCSPSSTSPTASAPRRTSTRGVSSSGCTS